MLDQLPGLLGFELSELAGAHASGEIPVQALLINRLIAARLARSGSPIESLTVEPRPGEVILVHVRLRTSFVPALTVQALIDEQPHLPDSPVLVLRWSLLGLGRLARLASPVLALFDLLPPGISVDGDRIAVNLQAILAAKGQADVLPLLRELEIRTIEGGVLVRFAVRVEGERRT